MVTVQQEETLQYFKTHAEKWWNTASNSDENRVNIIKQRNNYVLDVIKERKETRTALDVGCGSGDLVCDIAKMGINTTGIDFAQEMITEALKKVKNDRIEKARFECCSIFNFDCSQ